mgnify:CR=1 FL=1
MTLKEAKKILKKEFLEIGFKKYDKPLKFEEKLWIRNEKPEVLEALHIMAKNGIGVFVPETALRIRSIIIKKMRAGEGAPAPVSDTPLSAAEGIKLRWKDNKNTDKNPALKEAASQFNDALLDEQGKKIKRFGKEITRLNKIIHKKNLKIAEKDEVITDLGKELKAMKQQLDSYTKMAQKMAEVIVLKKPVTVDFFEMCWELAYSEEKEAAEELSKVLNDVIDRFLLFCGIITKEE